ncbi:hypothetical protein SPI_03341 [Niveomyces insectorum RCEF 264]|uniref:Uncharacterized protein n=1 Tax=Niveomyces insectorum RCEF 264 TaxID=1081102 RepID=A0A167X9G9_9HYPO|nr:hypothetical protein SPI_03341 [Niveomyces insectorum RCEF 264]
MYASVTLTDDTATLKTTISTVPGVTYSVSLSYTFTASDGGASQFRWSAADKSGLVADQTSNNPNPTSYGTPVTAASQFTATDTETLFELDFSALVGSLDATLNNVVVTTCA